MAINLSDNINYNAPKHADARYGPWTGVTHANDNVIALQRAIGLTVGIQSGNTLLEYWYYSGVTDSDLVLKTVDVDLSNYARLDQNNTFVGDQEILGYILISGSTGSSIVRLRNTSISISGATGDVASITPGQIVLQGLIEDNAKLILRSTSPPHPEALRIELDGGQNLIDPHNGPTISQLGGGLVYRSIIGFQPYTGWTDGTVIFYTPIRGLSGATFVGDVDITGQYLINGVPFSGGTLDHTALFNLGWADSNHTGSPNMLAGFDGSGNPTYYPLSSGTTISTNPNSGIEILSGSTINTKYNSGLSSTLQVPTAVGGIPSGTTVSQLTGKTVVEMFNDILFPTVLPTYTIPTITITGVANQTLEYASTYTPSINAYGIKNDAGPYTQLRILRNGSPILTDTTLTQSLSSSIPSQFGYEDPNNPNYLYMISPTPYSESVAVPLGTLTYRVDGNYNSGLAKQNNKGVYDVRALAVRNVNAPQSGSTNFQSTLYTITGIYPYFYGNSATLPTASFIASQIAAGNGTKVLSSASGTLSIPYNVTGRYIWVAYETTYTTKTKWYVNALDSGDIDNSFITTVTTNSVDSPNAYWAAATYKMHWSVYTTTQTTFEFRNT